MASYTMPPRLNPTSARANKPSEAVTDTDARKNVGTTQSTVIGIR